MDLLLGFCKTCHNTEQRRSGQRGDISFWADGRWADLAVLSRFTMFMSLILNQQPKTSMFQSVDFLLRFQAKSLIKKNACLCEVGRFGFTMALLVLQTPAVFLITTRLLTAHDTDKYAVLTQSSPDLDLHRREREQNEATVNGIVIVLGCHGERMFIVGKLDCAYEKLRKHLIFLPRVTRSWPKDCYMEPSVRVVMGSWQRAEVNCDLRCWWNKALSAVWIGGGAVGNWSWETDTTLKLIWL